MDTVTITSKRNLSLDDLKPLISRHWTTKAGQDRLVVEGPTSCVYIYHPLLDGRNVDPKRIYLDYHSVDLIKKIIQVVGDDPELVIENDFGTVLPGDQFVARLRADSAWDWRA